MKHLLNNTAVRYKNWMRPILECKNENINPKNIDIQWGYCACECDQKTPIISHESKKLGRIVGEPSYFISGHNVKFCGFKSIPLEERFWDKVDKCDDGCWNWLGSLAGGGYGGIGVNGKMMYAHRISWEISFGKIPNGLWVLHRCDNKRCIRPDHLFLGTHQDNMDDMKSKGRWKGSFPHPISQEQAQQIRNLYDSGKYTQQNLADKFNCSRGTVKKCVYRIHPYN